jgi:hypothetical protein
MNDIQGDRHHTAVVHPYEHLWRLIDKLERIKNE